jgi:hypothetical protein
LVGRATNDTFTGLKTFSSAITASIISASGTITANSFVGALTGNASTATLADTADFANTAEEASTAATVTEAAQPSITSVGTLTTLNVSGNITASNISASGTIFGTFQQITGITVTSQSWASGSIYSSSISNANITSNTVVDVIPDNADYTIVLAAQLLPQNVSSTNEVIIFAVNEPTDDINVTLNLFK